MIFVERVEFRCRPDRLPPLPQLSWNPATLTLSSVWGRILPLSRRVLFTSEIPRRMAEFMRRIAQDRRSSTGPRKKKTLARATFRPRRGPASALQPVLDGGSDVFFRPEARKVHPGHHESGDQRLISARIRSSSVGFSGRGPLGASSIVMVLVRLRSRMLHESLPSPE